MASSQVEKDMDKHDAVEERTLSARGPKTPMCLKRPVRG